MYTRHKVSIFCGVASGILFYTENNFPSAFWLSMVIQPTFNSKCSVIEAAGRPSSTIGRFKSYAKLDVADGMILTTCFLEQFI